MVASRSYDTLAEDIRRRPAIGGRDDRELVRLATLAASSHNTQPWLFEPTADSVLVHPDRSRRCPAADPDEAHLYESLGCAAENLVHAASLQGLNARVHYEQDVDAVVVDLTPAPGMVPTPLSAALTTRQCTRSTYDGAPISADEIAVLEATGTGDRVRCVVATDRPTLAAVTALVERGDLAQYGDDAFRDELVSWIRFNARAARRSRDGLAGAASGRPSLPTRLARRIAPRVMTAPRQAATDRALLASSAGVAVFLTPADTRQAWVDAGRAYERFSLQADLLGIRSAFVNQPIEERALRPELEALLDTDDHAQLMVRFGRGPRGPYSLRRPVDDVIMT